MLQNGCRRIGKIIGAELASVVRINNSTYYYRNILAAGILRNDRMKKT
jgi:hypothetical protein